MIEIDVKVKLLEVEDGWVAQCTELPGCQSHGRTKQEAIDGVEEAVDAWLKTESEACQWLLEHPEENSPPDRLLEAVARQQKTTGADVLLFDIGMLPDHGGRVERTIEFLKDRGLI